MKKKSKKIFKSIISSKWRSKPVLLTYKKTKKKMDVSQRLLNKNKKNEIKSGTEPSVFWTYKKTKIKRMFVKYIYIFFRKSVYLQNVSWELYFGLLDVKKKEKWTLILTFVKKHIYFFSKVILPSEWSPEPYLSVLDLQER
jgi:hypothetical protein